MAYKKQVWSGSGDEPFGFSDAFDASCAVSAAPGAVDEWIGKIAAEVKKWLNDKTFNLDGEIAKKKKEWMSIGGALALWDGIVSGGFNKSQYALHMSREVREAPAKNVSDPYLAAAGCAAVTTTLRAVEAKDEAKKHRPISPTSRVMISSRVIAPAPVPVKVAKFNGLDFSNLKK